MGFRRCQFFSATTGLPFFVLRFPLTILLSAYYVPYPTSILYYIILRLMLWLATRGFTYVTHYYRPMFFHSAWPLSKIENHRQGRPSHLQISDGPKMARAALRRKFIDGPLKQHPRKPRSKFYAIGLHFGK